MNNTKKNILLIIVSIILIIIILIGINLGSFLVVSDNVQKADAIVVFSGDSGQRTERAVKLLEDGYGEYLILSGGKVYDETTMAELMKEHAIRIGVNEEKILVENKASTTHENSEFTKYIIEKNKFTSVIVVTSDYHTRRSKAAMEKSLENILIDGDEIQVISIPAKDDKFTTKWWTSGNSVLIVISEYLNLMGYWVKAYI